MFVLSLKKSCAEDKETVSRLYVSKVKLIQSWRYKTLAVIKRRIIQLNHLSLSLTKYSYRVNNSP